MLRSACELIDYTIRASDGEIGTVEDFYFDDSWWIIRYLVANSGTWARDRYVLLSPTVLLQPDWKRGIFPIAITRRQVEESPDITYEKPSGLVASFEPVMHEYYGWPDYTGGGQPITWSPGLSPFLDEQTTDPHLRSVSEVIGYTVHALDRDCGTVEDIILDDTGWEIKYIVADAVREGEHKKVLISTALIENLDWEEASFEVDLDSDEIFNSPEYDPSAPVNKDLEDKLVDYYGRPYQSK